MLGNFKIKKHTKYEIISYICLMISYAIATFLNKYERFRVFVLLGSLGLMAIAIVTYILSIKNNPNKIKLFHTKKYDVNISFEFLCNNHSVNDFDV